MRQLLFAALGAAGSLLLGLPGLTQISNTTSTFSGDIAATCLFDGLEDSYSMTYNADANQLREYIYFNVITNSPDIRIGLGQVNPNQQPMALNGATVKSTASLFQVVAGNSFWRANSTQARSGTSLAFDISSGNNLRLDLNVWSTNPVDGKYQLGPGQYSYSFTVSCLL